MNLKIAVLPGDGIGPEIMSQGIAVADAIAEKFGHTIEYKEAICGAAAIDRVGNPFPDETFETCKWADAVLFAAVGDPRFDNDPTAKVRPEQGLLAMRKKLGLFANIRPVQTFKCLLHKSPLKDELIAGADFICIRELTGGMYFGEKYQDNDKAYDTNYYTRPEIERILRVAYEYARKRKRHLTVVDKANVLASSRLWRQIAKELEPEYPDVKTDYMFVDNASREYVWRHTYRRRQLHIRQHGPASFRLDRRKHSRIRACARLLAASGRKKHCKPVGANTLRGNAFRTFRPEGRRLFNKKSRRCVA